MSSRFRLILAAVTVLFLVGVAYLFKLQVVKRDYYRSLSENNRIRIERLKPPRGLIYDFKGELLAGNLPSFNLFLVKEDMSKDPREREEVLENLSKVLGVRKEDIKNTLKRYRGLPPFVPIPIAKDIGKEKAIVIEANPEKFRGVRVIPSLKRYYPGGRCLSHVLGYLGEVSRKDLDKGYYPGDMIGKDGVEKTLEGYLRGKDGGMEVEVNAMGRRIKVLGRVEPVRGDDVYLTVDKGLQRLCERLFQGKAGGVVVMDPSTGRIYALYSSPSFDPNWFSTGISPDRWRSLIKNPLKPLNNRVISCSYAPGSTFKVVVALAALMEGVIDEKTSFFCGGYLFFKGRKYRCWKDYGHGEVDIYRAIAESCDVFFYNLGLRMGVDTIARYAKGLGLGGKTGIGLPGERCGLVPTSSWKLKALHERWYKGETLSLVIGQGFIHVTPIQQAVMLSAVVNGGYVLKPFIVSRIVDRAGEVVYEGRRKVVRRFALDSRAVEVVRKAMLMVVEGEKGTGRKAMIEGFDVAGKTGTAQVVRMKKRIKDVKKIPYRFRDHAWFIAFAPYKAPRFVVAVVVEHGGHGGDVAAPIAREVLRYALYNL